MHTCTLTQTYTHTSTQTYAYSVCTLTQTHDQMLAHIETRVACIAFKRLTQLTLTPQTHDHMHYTHT